MISEYLRPRSSQIDSVLDHDRSDPAQLHISQVCWNGRRGVCFEAVIDTADCRELKLDLFKNTLLTILLVTTSLSEPGCALTYTSTTEAEPKIVDEQMMLSKCWNTCWKSVWFKVVRRCDGTWVGLLTQIYQMRFT